MDICLWINTVMFNHLQIHSHYSLLEWIWAPKWYVKKAKELWMNALAITDYNWLYWAIEFYKACKDENIHPIIWVELHCVHDITMKWHKSTWWGTIVLLAENKEWYQDLLKLVSHANMDWFDGTPRIDFELLKKYGSHLLCLVWWVRSLLWKLILANEPISKQEETLWLLKNACWEDAVYLMIHSHDESKFEEVKTVNKSIYSLAWYPFLITQDVHYITPEDQKPYEVALSIKDGKRVYDEDRRIVKIPLHLSSEDEVLGTMKWNWYDQEFISNCLSTIDTVIERCQCEISLNQLLFPKYEAPDEIRKLYEANKNWLIV